MSKTLVEMTADIVQAQSSSKSMTTEEITLALQNTFITLQGLQLCEQACEMPPGQETPHSDTLGASISPEKSIQKNKIICIECGQEFKMLSPKHLKSHGLTGREYRQKHGFSLRQPLCAKSLSDRRKKAGQKRGLPDNLRKAIAKKKKNRATNTKK